MYEIKVLSNEEFDQVAKSDPRYSYVNETNLGFADRQKGIAYVRQTGVHDLNKYLISHELEELEEDESTHEDPNGIRHKNFGNIFSSLLGGGGGMFSNVGNFFGSLFSPFIRAATVGPTQTFNEMLGRGQQSQVFTSQQQQQFQQPSGGSYVPQSSIFLSNGGYGSPLSLFSGSGSYTPNQVPSAASGLSDPGSGALGGDETPEWMKQQKYGSENGRIMFK